MKHIKSLENFLNEQLFSDGEKFSDLLGLKKGENKGGETKGTSSSSPQVKTSRNDESSCPNSDCWSYFGKDAFWNGTSKIGDKTVPKITINKSPSSFNIKYEGQLSGFLLKHPKGSKGDTVHQLLNVLTLELNEYMKDINAKPDVKGIKMDLSGNKLSVEVPLSRAPLSKEYKIARRGGLGHGGDFSDLEKYKKMEGYEEAKYKSGNLTEKFVSYVSK